MDLYQLNTLDIIKLLKAKEISPLDCLSSLQKRISNVNKIVNALVTLCFERAELNAKKIMERDIKDRGMLQGLPVPIKDLTDVSGVRCTSGSPIYKDRIAENSDILVKNIESKGGIIYAMTNTPEFGAGANTFNEVFGYTLNPWDITKSAAGSSGGAAVALSTGMAWVAHGSDMGGSLRNPASFCSVVGMRPSPGRVASTPSGILDGTLGVNGPMARNVLDLAFFLDAMSGENYRDPVSQIKPDESYLSYAKLNNKPKKIAISKDLGLPPVDPEIQNVVLDVGKTLEKHGLIVEEAHPDLKEAPVTSKILRSLAFYVNLKSQYKNNKKLLKPEIIWNIEEGMKLSMEEISYAQNQRVNIFNRMQSFFEEYDLLICPATIVTPFPVKERYVKECNGVEFSNYVEWLNIVSAITLTSSPAISLPAGFSKEKLPIGVQLISKCKDEANLLSYARFIEQCLNIDNPIPIDPIN